MIPRSLFATLFLLTNLTIGTIHAEEYKRNEFAVAVGAAKLADHDTKVSLEAYIQHYFSTRFGIEASMLYIPTNEVKFLHPNASFPLQYRLSETFLPIRFSFVTNVYQASISNIYILAGIGLLYGSRTTNRLDPVPPELDEIFPAKESISGFDAEVVGGIGAQFILSEHISVSPRFTFAWGADGADYETITFCAGYRF